MKHRVFISYRRKGGTAPANVVRMIIEQRLPHYSVYMDVKDHHAGYFDKQLSAAIADTDYFLLIVSPGCFEEKSGVDYFLQEIDLALEQNKNIIPITFDERLSAHNIPVYLREKQLHLFQQIDYNSSYSEAFADKLVGFLAEAPNPAWKKFVYPALLLIFSAFCCCAGILYYSNENTADAERLSSPENDGINTQEECVAEMLPSTDELPRQSPPVVVSTNDEAEQEPANGSEIADKTAKPPRDAKLLEIIIAIETATCRNTMDREFRNKLKDLFCRIAFNDAGVNDPLPDETNTPLHYACAMNQPLVVEWLLEHGADAQARNKRGETPPDCAKAQKSGDVLKLLKRRGIK